MTRNVEEAFFMSLEGDSNEQLIIFNIVFFCIEL